jgi:hypothetical protein
VALVVRTRLTLAVTRDMMQGVMGTTYLSGQKDIFTGGIFNFSNPYAVSEDVGLESRISQSSH